MKKKKKEKSPKVTKAKVRVQKKQINAELIALKSQLKIEASLDRVRKKALRMKKPHDLLTICKTLYSELQLLGFDALRNCMINIHNDDSESFLNYDYARTGPSITHFTYHIHPVIESLVRQMKKSRTAFSEHVLSGKKLDEFKAFRKSQGEKTDTKLRDAKALYYYFYSIGTGALGISNLAPLDNDQLKILKRFRNVFDLAYQRYADIQKAEAQAREARIEAALEKVRSRSLAMHQSDELEQVVASLFDRLVELGLSFDGALIFIFEKEKRNIRLWIATTHLSAPVKIDLPYDEDIKNNVIIKDLWIAIEKGEHVFNRSYSGKTKNDYFRYVAKYNESKIPESVRKIQMEADSWTTYFAPEKNSMIGFDSWSGHNITSEDFQTLIRFARVFEQTYTRFLDLQKAEAQAREAQIEAALEKMRSRSLTMQKSDELKDIVEVLFEKLKELGLTFDGGAGIHLFSENSRDAVIWVVSPELTAPICNNLPYDEKAFENNPIILDVWEAKNTGIHLINKTYSFEEKNKYFDYVFKHNDETVLPEVARTFIKNAKSYTATFIAEKNSLLGANSWSEQVFSDNDIVVLKRVARVFDQAYIRFLDLQKAEAQAREALIEAALERIRSRALAMHTSGDLIDVANVLRDQMGLLGQPELESSIVHLYHDNSNTFEAWYAYRPPDRPSGKIITGAATVHTDSSEWSREVIEKYGSQNNEYTIISSGQKINEWYKVLEAIAPAVVEYDHDGRLIVPEILYYHFSKFSGGALLMISNQQPSVEARELQKRAAVVFGLAVTRFLDLKKAEEQAREAKIEASLERVRGKAMAMHSSEDLAAAIGIFYRELESFSITPRRCGVGLLDKETRVAELSTMNTTDKGDSTEVVGKIKMQGHTVLEGVYDNWILQQEYHPVLRGNEIKEYYQLLRPQISFPEYPNDAVQYGYFFFFPEGGVYAWTEKELTEDELKIYRKFTSVLSLTYKRYKDLRDAEIRAKEAVKQATLDRVRAEIASMRTKQDLDRITPLIWNELTILGIPFVRCGVFIMDDKLHQVHAFLSTPRGKAIGAFQLDYETSNLKEAIKHWHDKKVYVTHWGEKEFSEMAGTLQKQGSIVSRGQYLDTLPTEDIYLHFLPFMQGMLYVGNITPLDQEDIHLLQSLADAFSTAYARYEDFTKLEAAKQQVDEALVELKQTQQQLIQSEKMASLGELTAGIAHEIQNPLNFVNNFSDVSNELLDEMMEEVAKGNHDEAKAIADDVKQNLEKISHHGKRADGIVKGMLQHSRTSSGQKELTDINELADEYLRLAYHGLRAKDKSFNAKFETNLDSTLEKINVIPQDIGRVILNLINNAFYAVTEKRKTNPDGYEPTVSISTRKLDGKVEITVKDNGNGISQKVLDKIFQPFFTTKPTGQGTGLGLSLSYDIIKAHSGELKVETKEGEGSTFIIHLNHELTL